MPTLETEMVTFGDKSCAKCWRDPGQGDDQAVFILEHHHRLEAQKVSAGEVVRTHAARQADRR